MQVGSGKFAGPNGRRPLRVMTLKYEIVRAQALRVREKLVGMSGRFVQVTQSHRMIVEAPLRLEPRRAVLARVESHSTPINRLNLYRPGAFHHHKGRSELDA